MRLMVLRVTARGAKRFAMTIPRRACGNWRDLAYSTKWAVRRVGRIRKTDEKSSVLTIRRSRSNVLATRLAQASCAVLYRQAPAAFGAARIQHIATTAGSHAGAETVGAFAAHNGRLISTFHYDLVISAGVNRVIYPPARRE